MTSNTFSRYSPTNEGLRQFYIGKDIGEVPKPAVVLDVAIIKHHCQTMLQTIKQLGTSLTGGPDIKLTIPRHRKSPVSKSAQNPAKQTL
jgi:hypothetical protein